MSTEDRIFIKSMAYVDDLPEHLDEAIALLTNYLNDGYTEWEIRTDHGAYYDVEFHKWQPESDTDYEMRKMREGMEERRERALYNELHKKYGAVTTDTSPTE